MATKFTLHWSPKSPFVRKVMIVAHELGLTDQITLVRSVASMGSTNPAIMAHNPLNKIPTLICADGLVVVDSLVICAFLSESAADRRIFPDSPYRWKSLVLHSLTNGLIDLLILWRNETQKPGEQQTPAWIAAFELKALATLDRLESQATEHMEAPLCIGQITLGCLLGYLDFRFPDINWRLGRPGLTAWFAEVSLRPSFVATETVDG